MGPGKFIIRLACLLLMLSSCFTLDAQQRTFDRKKWNELRNEIKKRRYEKSEYISSDDVERENSTYNNYEDYEGNTGDNSSSNSSESENSSSGSSRHSNSDYSTSDVEESGGSGDETIPEGDPDIFDDTDGEGTASEDEMGNSTWNEDETNGDGNGGTTRENDVYYQRDNQEPDDRENNTGSYSSDSTGSAAISPVVLYILLGAMLVVVVFLILRSIDWKNRKVKKAPVTITDKFENLEFTKTELEIAIEKALAEGNYREAVRIYFLAVVKALRDGNLIKWEKKKTNYAYLSEMASHPRFAGFEFATRIFEVVWYGNRKISLEEFKSVEPVYTQLLKDISKK